MWIQRLLALLIPLGLAAPAVAAVLPVTGTYLVQLATLPTVTLSGTGSASSAGAAGSAHTLPSGFFTVATPISIPIMPTFTALDSFSVPTGVHNVAGSFGPNGAMPLVGSVAFFANGNPAGFVPLTPVGGTGMAAFQLGGLNGTLSGATFQGAGGPTPLVFVLANAALAIPITVTATAYDNRTAGGVGAVQLVAPATGNIGIFGAIPVFGVLQIEYTPEPGTWLLLGGGLTALGAAARRARRGTLR